MVVLVLGPNSSGKSAYAEKLTAPVSPAYPLYYLATMIPYGREGLARVEKHRKRRAFAGYLTVEEPFRVSGIPLPLNAVVLLEDVSNLLSNVLFAGPQGGGDSVYADITAMCGKCRAAVLVSIDGLTARPEYNEETRNYIEALNRLNTRLAAYADAVAVMRGGLPVIAKGESPCAGLGL